MNHPHINPGIFEIYCGPVKSGKTREILNRVDKIKYIEDRVNMIILDGLSQTMV